MMTTCEACAFNGTAGIHRTSYLRSTSFGMQRALSLQPRLSGRFSTTNSRQNCKRPTFAVTSIRQSGLIWTLTETTISRCTSLHQQSTSCLCFLGNQNRNEGVGYFGLKSESSCLVLECNRLRCKKKNSRHSQLVHSKVPGGIESDQKLERSSNDWLGEIDSVQKVQEADIVENDRSVKSEGSYQEEESVDRQHINGQDWIYQASETSDSSNNEGVSRRKNEHFEGSEISLAKVKSKLQTELEGVKKEYLDETEKSKKEYLNKAQTSNTEGTNSVKQQELGSQSVQPKTKIQVARERWIPCSKDELIRSLCDGFTTKEEAQEFVTVCAMSESVIHAEHKVTLEELRLDYNLTTVTISDVETPAFLVVLANVRAASKSLTSVASKALLAVSSLFMKVAGIGPAGKRQIVQINLRTGGSFLTNLSKKFQQEAPRAVSSLAVPLNDSSTAGADGQAGPSEGESAAVGSKVQGSRVGGGDIRGNKGGHELLDGNTMGDVVNGAAGYLNSKNLREETKSKLSAAKEATSLGQERLLSAVAEATVRAKVAADNTPCPEGSFPYVNLDGAGEIRNELGNESKEERESGRDVGTSGMQKSLEVNGNSQDGDLSPNEKEFLVKALDSVQQLVSEKLDEVDIDKGVKAVESAVRQVEVLLGEALGSGEARSPGQALAEGQGLGWDTEAMTPGGPDGQVAAGGGAIDVAELLMSGSTAAEDELERAQQLAAEQAARAEEAAARFEQNFMRLLEGAQFEVLSSRDLQLTAALNSDYLLTLPIDVDWKRASSTQAILFRRGYTTERDEGFMLGEKADFLQSAALKAAFNSLTGTLLKPGQWSIKRWRTLARERPWVESLRRWLFEPLRPGKADNSPPSPFRKLRTNQSRDNSTGGSAQPMGVQKRSASAKSVGLPIWEAARQAVPRYEAVLSSAGSRGMLLRRLLAFTGLLPPIPAESRAFPLALQSEDEEVPLEPHLRPRYVTRIAMKDIWQPASHQVAGRSLWRRFRVAVSVFFSRSELQEPAFKELVLLYRKAGLEQDEERRGQGRLQLQAFENIPIPDLKVVFPDKKLNFRVLDTVRLDLTTVIGLVAFLINFRFDDFLSSPSAFVLDLIATVSLAVFLTRALLGYKRTWDRYQLLVNRTLYEKTLANGFRTVHFLVDSSEEQQLKEVALAYGMLLKEGGPMTVGELQASCERFLYWHFLVQVEMPIHKAVTALVRLGLATVRPKPKTDPAAHRSIQSNQPDSVTATLDDPMAEGLLAGEKKAESLVEAALPKMSVAPKGLTTLTNPSSEMVRTALVGASLPFSGVEKLTPGSALGVGGGHQGLEDEKGVGECRSGDGVEGKEGEEEDGDGGMEEWLEREVVVIEPGNGRERLQERWMELLHESPAWSGFKVAERLEDQGAMGPRPTDDLSM